MPCELAGYRYVETDVHATSDGILLAFHDSTLDRVTDRPGVIGDLPWAQVRQAKIAGTEAIPLLEDLLGTWPELRVNIDIKAVAMFWLGCATRSRNMSVAALGHVDCLQVPERQGRVRIVSARSVQVAHEAGKQVHVWTVNEPADMRRLLDLGVDGIMTDRADLLRKVLIECGAWPS